ncbi:M15 family metallopeptidase [Rickettsiales bacterium]|nr:M15 family metallopeptidase [Rickettsiales bacterium]
MYSAFKMLSFLIFATASIFISKYIYDKKHKPTYIFIECDDVKDRIVPVPIEYIDFEGKTQLGHLYVMDAVAEETQVAFAELKKINFPVFCIRNKDDYRPAKDTCLQYENTTGAFSPRKIVNSKTGRRSSHSYGLAIDINPLQNPYIGIDPVKETLMAKTIPSGGVHYINRTPIRPGKEPRKGIIDEKIAQIMDKYGFNIWGGYYDFPIDYMHFQLSSSMAVMLVNMSTADSKKFFKIHVKLNRLLRKYGMNQDNKDIVDFLYQELYPSKKDTNAEELAEIYKANPKHFFEITTKIIKGYESALLETQKNTNNKKRK